MARMLDKTADVGTGSVASKNQLRQRRSLLSSDARIQAPWVKVTIVGDNNKFTFGVFSRKDRETLKDANEVYLKREYNVQYPNYIRSLQITKINGQVNQYVLNIIYPITIHDDPNFFEKIFSSASKTRKIIFSYGDALTPSSIYREEEALITTVTQVFNLESSAITYTVNAISSSALTTIGCDNFNKRVAKPSDVIKELFRSNRGNIAGAFPGMKETNLDELIAGTDKVVEINAQQNMSVLEYISYLVSYMYPANCPESSEATSVYILTVRDNTETESLYNDTGLTQDVSGAYFEVKEVNYATEKSDAYEIDVGYNTRTIVQSFSVENNENYSIYWNYQNKLDANQYVRRINDAGQWEDVYAPISSSKNTLHETTPADRTWWTKVTQFPINASITVNGLLRPAYLLTYVRLNIIFPGGTWSDNTRMHVASGLYLITKQVDTIDDNGYKTALSLVRVGGGLVKEGITNTAATNIASAIEQYV